MVDVIEAQVRAIVREELERHATAIASALHRGQCGVVEEETPRRTGEDEQPATDPLGPMIRIKDLRLAHGWTMNQLAERIGEHGVSITEAGISNVENGNKKASDRLLIAWAKALGIGPMTVWHGPLRKPVETGISPQTGRAA